MEQVFNKLVRDNIPEIIEKNGDIAITRVLEDDEYKVELYKKLQEECLEVVNSKSSDELLQELGDVIEVINSIANIENKNLNDIIEIEKQKN